MAKATINDARLFYELTGDSGEPLVLVHGSWVDHHNWDAVVPMLSRSFRVLTYDRRGHSQSPRPASPYSIRAEVADLAGLIEELDLAPAHVVGASSGGSVVLRLAAARPQLFRSLVVHEAPLFDLLADESLRLALKAPIDAVVGLLEAGDTEGGARRFVETMLGPDAWTEIPPEVKETVIANAPTFLDEVHDPDFLSIDLAALQRFPRPALLTLGEESPPFFSPVVETLASALPHVQRKTFPGAGHEPEETHPEAYVTAISEFVGSLFGSFPVSS